MKMDLHSFGLDFGHCANDMLTWLVKEVMKGTRGASPIYILINQKYLNHSYTILGAI